MSAAAERALSAAVTSGRTSVASRACAEERLFIATNATAATAMSRTTTKPKLEKSFARIDCSLLADMVVVTLLGFGAGFGPVIGRAQPRIRSRRQPGAGRQTGLGSGGGGSERAACPARLEAR